MIVRLRRWLTGVYGNLRWILPLTLGSKFEQDVCRGRADNVSFHICVAFHWQSLRGEASSLSKPIDVRNSVTDSERGSDRLRSSQTSCRNVRGRSEERTYIAAPLFLLPLFSRHSCLNKSFFSSRFGQLLPFSLSSAIFLPLLSV